MTDTNKSKLIEAVEGLKRQADYTYDNLLYGHKDYCKGVDDLAALINRHFDGNPQPAPQVSAEVVELVEAAKELDAIYSYWWDRADRPKGKPEIMLMDFGIAKFEKAHAKLHKALAPMQNTGGSDEQVIDPEIDKEIAELLVGVLTHGFNSGTFRTESILATIRDNYEITIRRKDAR